jgi:hypothetical protein
MYAGSAPPHSSSCPAASATAAICGRSAWTASRTSISATAGMLPRGGAVGQAARRRTSHTVAAISSADSTSSQPPSIHWNGQNLLAG